MLLVVGTLVSWSLYSRHKAQMEAEERQHLYEERHQQEERQRERVKEEQQRQQEEACAEKSAPKRQNSAIGASQSAPSNSTLMPQRPEFKGTKGFGVEPPYRTP
jgi:hypothetical protein